MIDENKSTSELGIFGQIKSFFVKEKNKEVDFILIKDDGEPVPEITVEEIEEAESEDFEDRNDPEVGC